MAALRYLLIRISPLFGPELQGFPGTGTFRFILYKIGIRQKKKDETGQRN
jgi:hypothetical protein